MHISNNIFVALDTHMNTQTQRPTRTLTQTHTQTLSHSHTTRNTHAHIQQSFHCHCRTEALFTIFRVLTLVLCLKALSRSRAVAGAHVQAFSQDPRSTKPHTKNHKDTHNTTHTISLTHTTRNTHTRYRNEPAPVFPLTFLCSSVVHHSKHSSRSTVKKKTRTTKRKKT